MRRAFPKKKKPHSLTHDVATLSRGGPQLELSRSPWLLPVGRARGRTGWKPSGITRRARTGAGVGRGGGGGTGVESGERAGEVGEQIGAARSGSNDAIRRVMQNDVTLRSGVTVLSQGQPVQGPAERFLPPARSLRGPSRGNPLLSSPRANPSLSLSLPLLLLLLLLLSHSLSLATLPRFRPSRSFCVLVYSSRSLIGLLCCLRTKCIVVKLSHARSTDRPGRDSDERRRRKPQPVDRRNRGTDI